MCVHTFTINFDSITIETIDEPETIDSETPAADPDSAAYAKQMLNKTINAAILHFIRAALLYVIL
jgi:hypothetical protein